MERKEYYTNATYECDKAKRKAKEILKEFIAEYGEQTYNWEENGDAPVIPSIHFGEDVAYAYITKIWLDNDSLIVNEHAYFLNEDKENIYLDNEFVDYVELLDWVVIYHYTK